MWIFQIALSVQCAFGVCKLQTPRTGSDHKIPSDEENHLMYCLLYRNLQHGGSKEKTLAFLQESYRILHELHRSRKLGCIMIQSLVKSEDVDHLFEQPKISANRSCSRPIAKAWFKLESTHLNKPKTSFMECFSVFFASPKANPFSEPFRLPR